MLYTFISRSPSDDTVCCATFWSIIMGLKLNPVQFFILDDTRSCCTINVFLPVHSWHSSFNWQTKQSHNYVKNYSFYSFSQIRNVKMPFKNYFYWNYRFAVWNTMMGTSLLSMPWAVEQAGLAAGLGIWFFPLLELYLTLCLYLGLILVMAAICFYTAYCILQVYGVYGKS